MFLILGSLYWMLCDYNLLRIPFPSHSLSIKKTIITSLGDLKYGIWAIALHFKVDHRQNRVILTVC